MTATITHFTDRRAPCGTIGKGEAQLEEDHQGLVSEEVRYACGCVTYRDEYHDGSVEHRAVRHDHRVLADGHDGEHSA